MYRYGIVEYHENVLIVILLKLYLFMTLLNILESPNLWTVSHLHVFPIYAFVFLDLVTNMFVCMCVYMFLYHYILMPLAQKVIVPV